MFCSCGNKMKVIDSVNNFVDNEIYRKHKCLACGNILYTCECEIEYIAIKEEYNKYYRKTVEND